MAEIWNRVGFNLVGFEGEWWVLRVINVNSKLMIKKHFVFLIIFLSVLTSFTKTKEFPAINYQTIDGKMITNSFFNGKRTLVIMAHLGCPPAMLLIKDLQTLTTEKFQTIIILENTNQQIKDFNSDEKNDWSSIRQYFHLEPITINIVAECENSSTKSGDGNTIIDSQCRKLAKKIKTKDSPTLVFVDEKGTITNIIKGYFGDKERDERLGKLLEVH